MSVEVINRFLATTTGREKACRFIQYFCRFYVFYMLRTGSPKEAIQRWDNLKANVSIARKFFRLFKQFEFAQAGVKSLSIQDEFLRFTGAGKQAAMFLYYCSEAVVLFHTIKFYNLPNAKKVQEFGFKCWLTGLILSILSSIYKYRALGHRTTLLQKGLRASEKGSLEQSELQTEVVKLQKEKKALNKQLLQDVVDAIIPTASLGLVSFDEGVVGLAGMITSWLAITSQWKKVNN